MPTFIDTEDHKFNYNLIRIAEADYKLFLKADNPEVKMLGILANFGKEDTYTVVKAIVDQMQTFANGDFAENRYFKQLRIFVQLRGNVEQQFLKVMESITKFFKEENDFLYRKGTEKTTIEIAVKMKKSGLEINLISSITGLSVEEIKKL